jgi:hypothetical protein
MQYEIVAVQVPLPLIGVFYAHNFLELVQINGDGSKQVLQTFEGVPTPGTSALSQDGFSLFGNTTGDYLQAVQFTNPLDDPIFTQLGPSATSTQTVLVGDPDLVLNTWNNAISTAQSALSSGTFLYNGASLFSSNTTINSNSVFNTTIEAITDGALMVVISTGRL